MMATEYTRRGNERPKSRHSQTIRGISPQKNIQDREARLFVAIPFPEEFKNTLIGIMQELKRQGVEGIFTPPERLHITLCFIGETTRMDEIVGALRNITWTPFSLTLSRPGHFKDLIWIGTAGGPELFELAEQIRKAFEDIGLRFDSKPFKPHITLVRKANRIVEEMHLPGACAGMKVQRISLMRSDRIDGKLVYTEVFHL